jgi:hypothetical protein
VLASSAIIATRGAMPKMAEAISPIAWNWAVSRIV